MAANNEIIEKIIQSKLPLDWVTPSKFAELTGIPEERLSYRKKKWREGLVWINDGNVYYSLKGFNEWQSQQAEKVYRKACGLGITDSKSTLQGLKNHTTSRSPIRPVRKASRLHLKLEAN